MSGRAIYLDYHATTPVDPRVLEAMLPYFTEAFGNPASSTHSFGWKAQQAVEKARRDVAALIGAQAREVVFTSGATESNNFAIKGATDRAPEGRRRIVTSAIEHKSVLEAFARLGGQGWDVVIVPVDRGGRVRLDAMAEAITPATALVSVMAANNEIGVVQPLAAIGALTSAAGAVFHVDAAQAIGKVPIDVTAMHIDLLSLTGHKFYGPKGCGALFIRKRTALEPLICGGGQERGARAGTENVAAIAGFGAAAEAVGKASAVEAPGISALRDQLEAGIMAIASDAVIFSKNAARLSNTTLFSVPGLKAETAVIAFDLEGVAVSSGSACSSGKVAPSHVLAAMGVDPELAKGAIRVSLGHSTGPEAVETFLKAWAKLAEGLYKARKNRDIAA